MKHQLTFLLLCLMFGCRTEKKIETGELSVTGQYCKYPENDFLSLSIQLFKNDTHIKNDTIEFSRAVKFAGLPYGNYQIRFESIYERQEIIEVQLKSNKQEIALCIDQIDYQPTRNELLIDQLKNNESLKMNFESSGCFHFDESEFLITRTDDGYTAKLDETKTVLSSTQIELIREFEIELREIESEQWCSTSDTYKLSIEGSSKTFEVIDESCDWRGFYNLIKKLDWRK